MKHKPNRITEPMTEFELISALTSDEVRSSDDLVRGVGDDCAVVKCNPDRDMLVTTDSFIESVHFIRDRTSLESLGRKSMAVNLSDIAAMGGAPRFYLVNLGLPEDMDVEDARTIYSGMRDRAREVSSIMIGGDTFASPAGLVISITVIGEVESGKSLYRGGAKPGDAIYVSGKFGSSALGLICLKRGLKEDRFEKFVKAHEDPSPRNKLGLWIASTDMASSMIDVSDGLLADLGHVADESGVGYEVEADEVPVEDSFREMASEIGEDPLRLALTGGEDYELLFTVKAGVIDRFEELLKKDDLLKSDVARIGTIKDNSKNRIVKGASGDDLDLDFDMSGFDHFRNQVP